MTAATTTTRNRYTAADHRASRPPLMLWCLEVGLARLSPAAYRVAAIVTTFASMEGGVIRPRVALVAELAQMDEGDVRAALAELVDIGLLVVLRQPSGMPTEYGLGAATGAVRRSSGDGRVRRTRPATPGARPPREHVHPGWQHNPGSTSTRGGVDDGGNATRGARPPGPPGVDVHPTITDSTDLKPLPPTPRAPTDPPSSEPAAEVAGEEPVVHRRGTGEESPPPPATEPAPPPAVTTARPSPSAPPARNATAAGGFVRETGGDPELQRERRARGVGVDPGSPEARWRALIGDAAFEWWGGDLLEPEGVEHLVALEIAPAHSRAEAVAGLRAAAHRAREEAGERRARREPVQPRQPEVPRAPAGMSTAGGLAFVALSRHAPMGQPPAPLPRHETRRPDARPAAKPDRVPTIAEQTAAFAALPLDEREGWIARVRQSAADLGGTVSETELERMAATRWWRSARSQPQRDAADSAA